jgi:CDP-paratose 2-epimerase
MKWLITGGAGFIGCNAAHRLMNDGCQVVILDNLSRRGADSNLQWLRNCAPFEFSKIDVRDFPSTADLFQSHPDIDVVLHLAAQVAVTTSVADPRIDFEVNALGTFNVCEAVRQFTPGAVLLNASTNKVYGGMTDVGVEERDGRYRYAALPQGVSEDRPLDFHSPYGCSKGSADQYVSDYARIYGLRTVNFRQSCIYGTRQFGVEDQGWVAWFAISAALGNPITIYGDGKQVRDVLFVDDLVECYLAAVHQIAHTSGQTYNVGGGPGNTISLLELIRELEELLGRAIPYSFSDWRPGDQRVFVCDIRKAKKGMGWEPKVSKREGVRKLAEWVVANRSLFERTPEPAPASAR